MPGFRVTPRAQEDLKNIGRYTEQQWGRHQRNIYLKALAQRFYWLVENPQLGKHRTDVPEGNYSFPQGEHLVAMVCQIPIEWLWRRFWSTACSTWHVVWQNYRSEAPRRLQCH